MPVMLDLFSGLGGAHAAMTDRGWKVISVDIEERFKPTIVGDVTSLPLQPFPVDLIWASPPCEQYSRLGLPRSWHPHAGAPDLLPWLATRGIIERFQPQFWVIENGRMAQNWWGPADMQVWHNYLWTNLPMLGTVPRPIGKRHMCSGTHPLRYWVRSKIAYPLSEAVAAVVEHLLRS